MAYRTQTHLEKAASMLLELLGADRECVPAMVCLSQCYLMLKQAPKARNHLKRVAKMPFVAELAEDFERGWLMLADVYIASGKYDLAEELCRRCLASNNACAKAWEFLGVVKEKEMSYLDAATHYEQAWKRGPFPLHTSVDTIRGLRLRRGSTGVRLRPRWGTSSPSTT